MIIFQRDLCSNGIKKGKFNALNNQPDDPDIAKAVNLLYKL